MVRTLPIAKAMRRREQELIAITVHAAEDWEVPRAARLAAPLSAVSQAMQDEEPPLARALARSWEGPVDRTVTSTIMTKRIAIAWPDATRRLTWPAMLQDATHS
jgi:hypothetical protein